MDGEASAVTKPAPPQLAFGACNDWLSRYTPKSDPRPFIIPHDNGCHFRLHQVWPIGM